ncbi:MAG: hypothetical protein U9Q81_04605 [Pseudomonadota bacterium]|nr:hypothetical protein [Pseudomonadota bacterium]
MLGALAAIALFMGSTSAIISVTRDSPQEVEQGRASAATVEVIEKVEAASEEGRGR